MSAAMTTGGVIGVQVTYGIGGTCSGRFERAEVEEVSTLELVKRVIGLPQEPGSPARTAEVLAGVLRGEREVDVEIADPSSSDASGTPVALDQPVLRERSGRQADAPPAADEEVRIRISESYRGGSPCRVGSHERASS